MANLIRALCCSLAFHIVLLATLSWRLFSPAETPVEPSSLSLAKITLQATLLKARGKTDEAQSFWRPDDTRRQEGPTADSASPYGTEGKFTDTGASALGLPQKPEDEYISSKELSSPAHPIAPVIVPFPQSTLPRKNSGHVILMVFISASGIVDRVDILESNLPQPFSEAARDTFLQARFAPGSLNNEAVKSRMKVEVTFTEDQY